MVFFQKNKKRKIKSLSLVRYGTVRLRTNLDRTGTEQAQNWHRTRTEQKQNRNRTGTEQAQNVLVPVPVPVLCLFCACSCLG